jgi:hypothetical protein
MLMPQLYSCGNQLAQRLILARGQVMIEDEARASACDLVNAALRSCSVALPASIEIEDDKRNEVRNLMPRLRLH